MPFRKGPIPKSLKCFIHNPAYMQQSIMRALPCRKTLPRTPLFSLAEYVFISNQQLLQFEAIRGRDLSTTSEAVQGRDLTLIT